MRIGIKIKHPRTSYTHLFQTFTHRFTCSIQIRALRILSKDNTNGNI